MAKHNWFFSLLTVDVSQSKKGGLVICWGGLGPAGGAGARAVEGGGRGGPKRWWSWGSPDAHPPTPPPESKAGAFCAVWDRDVWFSKVIVQIYFRPFSLC